MRVISITAHVLSVIGDNKLCVRIDNNHIQKISDLYSEKFSKIIIRDTITLNVKTAAFKISIPWNNLEDLIGMHIHITAYTNYYSFYVKKENIDENGIVRSNSKKHTGISFKASAIKNITINDE